MFELRRIFCATAWEEEPERLAFQEAVGECNEKSAASRGILYVPVSLVNIGNKRPLQYAVEDNIRECWYYVLVLSDGWGPPERNFERDYRLALQCAHDSALPMRGVFVMRRRGNRSEAAGSNLPLPDAEFETTAEFRRELDALLETWIAAS